MEHISRFKWFGMFVCACVCRWLFVSARHCEVLLRSAHPLHNIMNSRHAEGDKSFAIFFSLLLVLNIIHRNNSTQTEVHRDTHVTLILLYCGFSTFYFLIFINDFFTIFVANFIGFESDTNLKWNRNNKIIKRRRRKMIVYNITIDNDKLNLSYRSNDFNCFWQNLL